MLLRICGTISFIFLLSASKSIENNNDSPPERFRENREIEIGGDSLDLLMNPHPPVLMRTLAQTTESEIVQNPDNAIATSTLEPISEMEEEKSSRSVTIASSLPTTTDFEIDMQTTRQHQAGMTKLLTDLFADYNKESTPSTPVIVSLNVLLIKVKSTIEREGIFECVIALFIQWQENRFRWQPERYNSITTLSFDAERVWLPDIAMTNSADHVYAISKDTRFLVRVSNDGNSVFVPSATSRTWCDFRLAAFPFDQQTCSLEFESWTLDNASMAFDPSSAVIFDNPVDTTVKHVSIQWEVCTHETSIRNVTYQDSMGGTFQRIAFTFTVHRKPSFYLVNLIFPVAMLSIVQLLIFFIPGVDSASSRIAFGTTNLLTLVVFQTIVTAELPKTSESVPALSKYIIALILLTAYGCLESVIVERLLRRDHKEPPLWIRRLVECAFRNRLSHEVKPRVVTQQATIKNSIMMNLPRPKIPAPKVRRGSALVSATELMVYRYSTYWTHLALIIDIVSFAVCTFAVVVTPIILFVPLIIATDHLRCNIQ